MTYFPQVAALWTHAARRAQLTARRLGYTRRIDKMPEQEHAESVLEKALRDQSRKTLEVLRQELIVLSVATDREPVTCVRRHEVLHVVERLILEANEKRPSARPRRKR